MVVIIRKKLYILGMQKEKIGQHAISVVARTILKYLNKTLLTIKNDQMEKLELKHLKVYLDHKLQVQWSDGSISTINPELHEANHDESEITLHLMLFSLKNDPFPKPILHPLSDLLKSTKGYEYLIQIIDETDQQCDTYFKWCDAYLDNPDQSRILQAPYEVFEILVKKHFDVFGLIPKKLAIDINTIKQPVTN